MMARFVNKVLHGNALDLLEQLPLARSDGVIADPNCVKRRQVLYDANFSGWHQFACG